MTSDDTPIRVFMKLNPTEDDLPESPTYQSITTSPAIAGVLDNLVSIDLRAHGSSSHIVAMPVFGSSVIQKALGTVHAYVNFHPIKQADEHKYLDSAVQGTPLAIAIMFPYPTIKLIRGSIARILGKEDGLVEIVVEPAEISNIKKDT